MKILRKIRRVLWRIRNHDGISPSETMKRAR